MLVCDFFKKVFSFFFIFLPCVKLALCHLTMTMWCGSGNATYHC